MFFVSQQRNHVFLVVLQYRKYFLGFLDFPAQIRNHVDYVDYVRGFTFQQKPQIILDLFCVSQKCQKIHCVCAGEAKCTRKP